MEKPKIKWKVDPAPTGKYSSFSKRGWPIANYVDANESSCAAIYCEDDYNIRDAASGKHKPLELRLADHSKTPWRWVKVTKTFATLQEAKDGVLQLLEKYPHLMPKQEESK